MSRGPAARLWRGPAALAILTSFGLLAALFIGDPLSHWVCWLSLALLLTISICVLSPGGTNRNGRCV